MGGEEVNQQYLAVDLGSSNGKILQASLGEDGTLRMREAGRFATPRVWMGGHLCIDLYGVYEEICRTLMTLGKKQVPVRSIGVDAWVSDFGIVDAHGDMKGLPVFYRDRRTNGMPAEVEKVISYRELYGLTRQRKTQDTTLCQMIALLKERPDAFKEGDRIMHLGDLLMYFFSGRVCSEISAASYSQLFDMKKQCWEDRVFDLFGIPKSIRPPVVHAGEYLGQISKKHAAFLGTNQFDVIAPATHDTSSAGVAVPAEAGTNWAFIATGSWYLVSMELDEPADSELSYRYNLSNTGLAFGKTLLKRNVCAMWLIQECRRQWEKMGLACDYPRIAALAAQAVPFYAVIDTEDESFYNPDDMVGSITEYLKRTGQRPVSREDIGQIARIIYESIAFKCRYALEALKKTTGRKVDIVYVIGGASGVAFLNQMLAEAMNMEVISAPGEASAAGNILMQAVGTGELKNEEEVRAVVRKTFPMEHYRPEEPEAWDRKYPEFLQLCGLGSEPS